MPVTFDHVPILFSPAEVSKYTGVNERAQRNWRSRGILPPLEDGKHFRATVYDLAMLVVAKLVSDKLPLDRAVGWATLCAKGVAYHALCHEQAWENLSDGIPIKEFVYFQAGKATRDEYPQYGGVIPGRYFILWADGTEFFDHSLDAAFTEASPQQLRGAVLVLDLLELGNELVSRHHPFMRLVRNEGGK